MDAWSLYQELVIVLAKVDPGTDAAARLREVLSGLEESRRAGSPLRWPDEALEG